MLLGFMIFFPIVVAPSIFKNLNEKQSSLFLRSFFPKYYLFGIIISLIGIIVSYPENDLIIISSFIFIFLGFLFSRQYLTPLINKAKDEINKNKNLSKVKFEKLHQFSVLINILQIVICIIIVCYIIIF
tara:strand:- start:319 stop:705 length:387 start_codon:yes stop_codon:yes gene_type:complete